MMLQVAVLCALTLSAEAQNQPAAILVHPPTLSYVIATQSIKLICVAHGSPTPEFITWTSTNGKDLSYLANNPDSDSGATVNITQGIITVDSTDVRMSILKICNIDTTFSGDYTCAASNGVAGEGIAPSWATSTLRVTDPSAMSPAIVAHPLAENEVELGSSLEFTCIAYGIPVPDISWFRPGYFNIKNTSAENLFVYPSMVTVNSTTLRKSVLQICNVDRKDEAQYTCWADNGIAARSMLADSSFSFNIIVNDPITGTTAEGATTQQSASNEPTSYEGPVIAVLVVVLVLVLIVPVVIVVVVCCVRRFRKRTGPHMRFIRVKPVREEKDENAI